MTSFSCIFILYADSPSEKLRQLAQSDWAAAEPVRGNVAGHHSLRRELAVRVSTADLLYTVLTCVSIGWGINYWSILTVLRFIISEAFVERYRQLLHLCALHTAVGATSFRWYYSTWHSFHFSVGAPHPWILMNHFYFTLYKIFDIFSWTRPPANTNLETCVRMLRRHNQNEFIMRSITLVIRGPIDYMQYTINNLT